MRKLLESKDAAVRATVSLATEGMTMRAPKVINLKFEKTPLGHTIQVDWDNDMHLMHVIHEPCTTVNVADAIMNMAHTMMRENRVH